MHHTQFPQYPNDILQSVNRYHFVEPCENDKLNQKEHIVFIDSRFRNMGDSNVDFVVDLNKHLDPNNNPTEYSPQVVYRDVTSVELTAITTTNEYAVTSGEHYCILDIRELDNRISANTPAAHQQFAVVLFDITSSATITKSIKGIDFDRKIKQFNPPLSTLSRFTIRLLKPDNSGPIDDYGYVTMIFKITTKK